MGQQLLDQYAGNIQPLNKNLRGKRTHALFVSHFAYHQKL
jgi:hypothetical protein